MWRQAVCDFLGIITLAAIRQPNKQQISFLQLHKHYRADFFGDTLEHHNGITTQYFQNSFSNFPSSFFHQ
jgi:hypothetical protein